MEISEIGKFLLETPLYKKHTVDEFQLIILDILFYNGVIDCFCPKCGNHSIFQGENYDSYREQKKTDLTLGRDLPGLRAQKKPDYSGAYLLDFYCTRDKSHKLNFILKVDEEKLFKIGQSPSVLDLIKGDYKKYKNLLGDQFYDLNSAVLLYSNNFGIASFTHLRRIIENYFMTDAFRLWSEKNISPPSEELNRMKFKERMNLVKDYLPSAFTDNPSLYSIISKGIHDLSEESCIAYYVPVMECILLSLDEIDSLQKKKKSQEAIQKQLSSIASSVNNTR